MTITINSKIIKEQISNEFDFSIESLKKISKKFNVKPIFIVYKNGNEVVHHFDERGCWPEADDGPYLCPGGFYSWNKWPGKGYNLAIEVQIDDIRENDGIFEIDYEGNTYIFNYQHEESDLIKEIRKSQREEAEAINLR